MMPYVIAAAIALLAIIFVLAPLLRRPSSVASERPVAPPSPDESRAAATSSAIDELELDLAMGKLSKTDYEQLRARYEAAYPLAAAAPSRGLESRGSPSERAEAMILAQRATGIACATCGPRPEPDARFCSTCGRSLAVCPACGAVREESGAYCASCGASLAE